LVHIKRSNDKNLLLRQLKKTLFFNNPRYNFYYNLLSNKFVEHTAVLMNVLGMTLNGLIGCFDSVTIKTASLTSNEQIKLNFLGI